MVEEVVRSDKPTLQLKDTIVNTPHLEYADSTQSVAADEETASGSGQSRPSSSGSNAALINVYSTPPSSPPFASAKPQQDIRRKPTPAAAAASPPVIASARPIPQSEMEGAGMSARRSSPPYVRFDEKQIPRKPVSDSHSSSSSLPNRKSYPPPRTSMNRSPPAPDADDTPYIRFALDQLTRDEEVRGSRIYPTNDRWSTAPPYREAVMQGRQEAPLYSAPESFAIPRPYSKPRTDPRPQRLSNSMTYDPTQRSAYGTPPQDPRSTDDAGMSQPQLDMQGSSGYFTPPQEPVQSYRTSPVVTPVTQPQSQPPRNLALEPDLFVPFDSEVPSLRFLPGILRPLSFSIFIFLCLLMLAGITFSGAWSATHHGLYKYTTFGGARYFIFQYLPLICGMFLLLWLFQIQIAVQRISPFIAMASGDSLSRSEGPLMEFLPTNFLLPKLFYFRASQPIVGFCMLVFWLQIFTIPLLSTAYNVYFNSATGVGEWRWTAVQGVIWTLFVLYLLLVIALVLLGFWLWRQRTGLKWDPRSIADVVALIDRSNVTQDYEGSETLRSSRDFRDRLALRSDRLGYWTTSRRPNEVFYGIGEEGGATRRYSLQEGRLREKSPPEGVSGFFPDTPTTFGAQILDLENTDDFEEVRHRYIPWYLQTSFVLLWIAGGILLYLAFIIASFVNNAVLHGFSPLLPVRASSSGFSSTNFLYSFIPTVIAQLIFVSWLSVDFAFRRLQPYAAMSDSTNSGATATESLLQDYPARLPFSISLAALLSRDFRVAWFSFLSLILACVPVLAGGCFWAQWYIPAQEVRVAVHPPGFYALCVFISIFTVSLPLLVPGLHRRRLPHPCSTLAQQISFLYASQIPGEREWRAPLGSKAEMTTRLLSAATPQERAAGGGRFIFGRFIGKDGRTHLGIERVGRDGRKRTMRGTLRGEASGMLTTPPRVRQAPQGRPAQGGTVATGGRVEQSEPFPVLPTGVAGAGVAGAGAATYAYDYGSQQDLLSESQKAEYIRRKEGGSFGSPTFTPHTQTASASAPLIATAAAAPRTSDPVSPIDEPERAPGVFYDYRDSVGDSLEEPSAAAAASQPRAVAGHTHSRTASSPILPPAPQPYASDAPAVSLRDLPSSAQAEAVREREGGFLAPSRTSADARPPSLPQDVGADVGADLPSMLREAAKGRWSFE